jgi:hypothetical protein
MNGRKGLFVFGAGVAGTLCLIASAGAGCQNSGSGSGGNGTANGGNTTQGTATNSGPGGNGGNGSMSTSTISGSNTGGSTSASTGTMSTCTSDMDATIDQIAKGADNGGLGTGIHVKVTGAIAMSHKFLVSKSSSTGSCLWGVFLSMPGIDTTAAFSGVLAVSYGTDAVTNDAGKSFCPVPPLDPAGDAFPDDVAPGDVLDVIGKTDAFPSATHMLAGCTPQPAPQVQLANVCSAKKTTTAAVPKSAKTGFDVAKLGSGDASELAKWSGVKIELDNVTSGAPPCAEMSCTPPPNCSAGVAGCFGDIVLSGSNITVADKIYYQGLLRGAPFNKTCHNNPNYAAGPVTFTSVSGFMSDDFCNYALFPDSKCDDIVPQAPAVDIDCAMVGGCTDCMGGPGNCN